VELVTGEVAMGLVLHREFRFSPCH